MENLEIKSKSDVYFIPEVNLNATTGQCLLAGESYLEDTDEFYNNIINWLEAFIKEVKKPINFDFRLTYFNTSSSRSILNVLRVLKSYEDKGGNITVNWYYPEDDDSIAEEAEDYVKDTGLKINIFPLQDED
jgi:hypothetical protein